MVLRKQLYKGSILFIPGAFPEVEVGGNDMPSPYKK